MISDTCFSTTPSLPMHSVVDMCKESYCKGYYLFESSN